MNQFPPSLITIEDITGNKEQQSHCTLVTTGDPRVLPQVSFDPFQPNPWYFMPLNFLGLTFPPHHIPCYSQRQTL